MVLGSEFHAPPAVSEIQSFGGSEQPRSLKPDPTIHWQILLFVGNTYHKTYCPVNHKILFFQVVV